jgi:DNA mismatch repair protein MutS
MSNTPKLTPMLKQYLEIKGEHPDAILFYRMGDFYEMFFEDAEIASQILGIALTSRSHKDEENKIPMCGVPYHALTGYLAKMVQSGYRVALCEQVEDPKTAKGIVRREVVRVVSPGVTTDEQLLDEKAGCYLCAMVLGPVKGKERLVGLSFIDVSTGIFYVSEEQVAGANWEVVIDAIDRLRPAELLVPRSLLESESGLIKELQTQLSSLCLTAHQDFQFEKKTAFTTLQEHFKTTNMAGFGCARFTVALQAAGGLLLYIKESQKNSIDHIERLTPLLRGDYLIIDDASRRNLELTETLIGGKREGSLLATLDATQTPMGARLLRHWLLFPLQDLVAINNRLDAVHELVKNQETRQKLRAISTNIVDIERLCSRLVLNQGNARDVRSLSNSLDKLPDLLALMEKCSGELFTSMAANFDCLADIHTLICNAIREDAPVGLRDGGLIRDGFDMELDSLLALLRDGKKYILQLEQKERERSGLAKLKVGYNRVFGYYFEVSRSQGQDLPDYYIRKQTLVNAERFITPELKELEESIATAQERRLELEFSLFSQIRGKIAGEAKRILAASTTIAYLDVLASLAESAVRYRYCRPEMHEKMSINIIEGRHPVIERVLDHGRFVPNDLYLDHERDLLHIITGPNMAGKSTVLRQTALIVLMAHVGSFVPAESAAICLIDRIFTRVGAMDDLRKGQSTFMVEMNETANILNNATEKSLVILDEIGRGTSTYDGLAIAWAVAEELVLKNTIGIKTLFATHYHELIDLADSFDQVQNYSVTVKEWNDTIIFLHKLVRGGASRSYGIQVASLAGVPKAVIRRATSILKKIEQHRTIREKKRQVNSPQQFTLLPSQHSPLKAFFENVDPDLCSPKEALDLLYQAKKLYAAEENDKKDVI